MRRNDRPTILDPGAAPIPESRERSGGMKPALDKQKFGPWALVTGASSGIGKEFARQLAANGLNLVLVARRVELLEAIGNQLTEAHGIDYRALGLDLTKEDFIRPLVEATRDLDIGLLISDAGAGGP